MRPDLIRRLEALEARQGKTPRAIAINRARACLSETEFDKLSIDDKSGFKKLTDLELYWLDVSNITKLSDAELIEKLVKLLADDPISMEELLSKIDHDPIE